MIITVNKFDRKNNVQGKFKYLKYINFKTYYIHGEISFVHELIHFSQQVTICRTKVVAQRLYSHIFS